MKTYLFKVAKVEKSIISGPKYKCASSIYKSLILQPAPVETPAPVVYRSVKFNSYLFDLKYDNAEMIRFIANSLIQAESSLFKNESFLYVIVYECELGKAITPESEMILLLNINVRYTANDANTVIHNSLATYTTTEVKPWSYYAQKDIQIQRHTLRGSGRYEAIYVKDTPKNYAQTGGFLLGAGFIKKNTNDDFIGLSVAFERETGMAQKHVYMGAASSSNYYINSRGDITFHKRGDLYKGEFDNYRKVFSALWPLLSKRAFDENGVLIEKQKIVSNARPSMISEFKSQRRASYTKGGASEVFLLRAITMLSEYITAFCNFQNELQLWGHNLNYSVTGFGRTRELYLIAERALRIVNAYFPKQLTLASLQLDAQSETNAIPEPDTLRLGNRYQEASECFDRLVLICDWMRRNYIDYKIAPKIPDYTLEVGHVIVRGPYIGTDIYKESHFGNTPSNWPTLAQRNEWAGFHPTQGLHYITHFEIEVKPVPGHSYTQSIYSYFIDNYQGVPSFAPLPELQFRRPYSEDNQWLEQTSEIAADIEKVYLSFQLNALNFAELFAHFLTIIDSKPLTTDTRAAGDLPGEIIRTEQQKKNARVVYPKAIKRPVDLRPAGTLKDIPVPTAPFPDFKPLQMDARAIVKRCAKDFTKQEEDEQREIEQEQEKDRSQADRDAFKAQQDEIERRKLRASKKPRFKWRNEVDGLTPTEMMNERISLYNEIAGNLNVVADGIELVNDALAAFTCIAAPPATPLLLGERVALKAGRSLTKKVVRRIAEHSLDIELPELPEFEDQQEETEIEKPEYPPREGEVPRPRVRHKYKPPKKDETPEFTGDEPESRNWKECENGRARYIYHERGPRLDWPIIPDPANDVDLKIVEDYEPRGLRKLVQKNIRYFDDILEGGPCEEIAEDDPQARYRCIRATPRVPRA